MNGEFWASLGIFGVLFVFVTLWAGRRVPEAQGRTLWLTSIAVFVLAVAAVWIREVVT